MNLSNKIDDILLKKKLHIVTEANSRLRPATIVSNRGTVIEADHVRIVNHPKTGTKIAVIGIMPGIYPTLAGTYQRISEFSLIRRMRDFTSPGEYVPSPRQDATGWCEPDINGDYDAHKDFAWDRKFKTILTMFVANIKDITWSHESKINSEPDRYDYRYKHSRNFADKSIGWLFQDIVPDAIRNNALRHLITGINVTIDARSRQLGIDTAVKLLNINSTARGFVAAWDSRGHTGESLIPAEMIFAELPAFLEEESADYWNSL